jgi:hypothetical protein
LIPKYRGFESRPFLLVPADFLVAMVFYRNKLSGECCVILIGEDKHTLWIVNMQVNVGDKSGGAIQASL